MSFRGLLFQWDSTKQNPTKRVGLVQGGYSHHHHLIEMFSPWYSWKIAHWRLATITHSIVLMQSFIRT